MEGQYDYCQGTLGDDWFHAAMREGRCPRAFGPRPPTMYLPKIIPPFFTPFVIQARRAFLFQRERDTQMSDAKVTILTLGEMKEKGEKITMITAYDYPFARIFSEAGIDVILVGDSAANVCAGHDSTLPITMDEMFYHNKSVRRAKPRAMVGKSGV